MVLTAILQQKAYPSIQVVPATDVRIEAQCVIRLSTDMNSRTYVATAKSFKWKTVWKNGQPVRKEWCNLEIPGVGKRCVPPSYFVMWL